MNIYDIAKLCGVSTATVSRVINGGSVSAQTRAKVNAVLAQTGYRPNPYAQGINSGSMKLIGILVSEIDDLYYVRAVSVLERQARKMGYDIILYSVGKRPSHIGRYIDGLLSRRVDAIFTIGSAFHPVQDQLTAGGAVPIITINLETDHPECYNVFCDDAAAVGQTVQLLYTRGHCEFLYLYDTDTISGTKKLAGFRRAIEACGIPAENAPVFNCPRDIETARKTAAALLAQHPTVSAVLTSVDELAVGTLKAALTMGKAVPMDLAIVGYDNSVLSECSTPRITSVDNHVSDLCMLGIRLFSDLKEGKTVAKKSVLPCELVEKETT